MLFYLSNQKALKWQKLDQETFCRLGFALKVCVFTGASRHCTDAVGHKAKTGLDSKYKV